MIYHYDEAGHLIGESAGNGNPIRTYIWRDDVPLAQIDYVPARRVLYFDVDQLNTPRLVLSAVEGTAKDQSWNVVWTWNSDAFGSVLPNANAVVVAQPPHVVIPSLSRDLSRNAGFLTEFTLSNVEGGGMTGREFTLSIVEGIGMTWQSGWGSSPFSAPPRGGGRIGDNTTRSGLLRRRLTFTLCRSQKGEHCLNPERSEVELRSRPIRQPDRGNPQDGASRGRILSVLFLVRPRKRTNRVGLKFR